MQTVDFAILDERITRRASSAGIAMRICGAQRYLV
jgi:hypothetical protein